ncbi:MAG TPA: HNH endonuclease [Candidatus Acidoferrum sp.]|nr:HNH endonuclease [Candidatus Acidoferrum sp.]
MKTKKPNAELVLKQVDEVLVPRLRLSLTDRVVYLHLLRHTRLEGKRQLHFSISWLARGIHMSGGPVRESVRRLVSKGALRLVERSRSGHVVEVPLPDEIRVTTPISIRSRSPHDRNLDEMDFLQSKALREAIHARDAGFCFYCLRQLTPRIRCLDHVVPRARSGRNSYRNLVSSCVECNSTKSETRAENFLRSLYRKRRLTDAEFNGRLRALDALAAGKLRPPINGQLRGTNKTV